MPWYGWNAGLAEFCGHIFFARPLNKSATVVDLGANRGNFAREISSRYHAKVVSVEANPHLIPRLPTTDGCTALHYAVSDSVGEITLNLSDDVESSSVLDVHVGANQGAVAVPSITLPGLLKERGIEHVDLLKVDIEGAEIRMFAACPDDTLARVDQISIEFHDFCGQVPTADVEQVVSRLTRLGFSSIRFSRNNFDWLFFRRERIGVSVARVLWAKYVVRNAKGLSVVLRRKLGR